MQSKYSITKLNLFLLLLCSLFSGVGFAFVARLFGISFPLNLQFMIFVFSCAAAGIAIGTIAFLINKLTIIRAIKIIGLELETLSKSEEILIRAQEARSNDEIGHLVLGFNAFVQRLNSINQDTRKLADKMYEESTDCNTGLHHAGDILKTVHDNIESIVKISNEQSGMIDETEQTLKKFTKNIDNMVSDSTILSDNFKDFNHHMQKQANSIQLFFSHIENLKHSLGDHTNQADDHRESQKDLLGTTVHFIRESTKSIDEQTQRFSNIEKLLEEIAGIAESTHLLSINASIEAARAGESGRGFTIVALQIRNLAKNAGNLTVEIREQMEAIINMTKNSGAQLVNLKTLLHSHIDNVSTDMQQLQNSSKEIDKTMELTSKIRHKLKECIDDICNSFSEINILQRHLLQPIEILQTHTGKLHKSVSRINLGSEEVEKVAQEFFEKGSATERQAYNLVKNIYSYQVVHNENTESVDQGPLVDEVNASESNESETAAG